MELLLPLPKTEIQNLFNMKVLSCTKDVPFSSIFFMLFSKQSVPPYPLSFWSNGRENSRF